MGTVRIDYLVFGYRIYKIDPQEIAEIGSRLLHGGINVKIKGDGTFLAAERDRNKILSVLSDKSYRETEPRGLIGAFKRFPYKAALIFGVLLSFTVVFLLSGLVWDIRVTGNESLPEAVIIKELERAGFSVGDLWASCDTDAIEIKLLAESKSIGWININRRGTVAYVTVIERKQFETPDENTNSGYANIVAAADCVIEDVTVKRGRALVKPGDTVKKGDVLVLGVLPDEVGGAFCRAEATVIGRVSDKVTVSVAREYEQKNVISEQCREISLKIFGFDVNIFKNYGNLSDSCDIIEEINTLSLLGRHKLPVTVSQRSAREYETRLLSYTDSELVEVATARLRAATAARLEYADLMKIRTEGEFTEGGYTVSNIISLTENVGVYSSFYVE